MLQGPLLIPQAGLLSGRRFGLLPLLSPTRRFRLLRWSVAGCNLHVVQHSCLLVPHAMGANFCYRTSPVLVRDCSEIQSGKKRRKALRHSGTGAEAFVKPGPEAYKYFPYDVLFDEINVVMQPSMSVQHVLIYCIILLKIICNTLPVLMYDYNKVYCNTIRLFFLISCATPPLSYPRV